MAVSFFKKSFSAYYGYDNKVTSPDTVEDEDEEGTADEQSDQSGDEEEKPSKSEGRVQRLAKSKSAYEIVNLAKKNLVDKLSANVTKLATYDHHSLLKSIQKEGDDSDEDDDEFLDSYDQAEEASSFSLYEQGKGLPNQPFSLVIPKALPIDLKQQILQQQIIDSSSLEDEDEEEAKSSDEDRQIDFGLYDEYGFLKTTKKRPTEKRASENLMRIDSEEEPQSSRKAEEDEQEPAGRSEKSSAKNDEKQFEKLRNKWLTYLELTYSQVDEPSAKWYQSIEPRIKHTPKLDSLIEGSPVPFFLRSQLWPRFCRSREMKEKCELSYSTLCKNSNHIKTCNDKHSLRILPNNVCFQDPLSKVNQSLRRILRVIKWIERDGVDPILNNSEALNLPLVAAYLLLIFNEEDVFWLLLSISNEWKVVFTNKTALFGKPNNNDLIKSLIKKHCPELEERLEQEEIDLNVLTNNWFTGLFADVISDTHILLYLWDLYFYYGFIVIFQLTFGLLLYRKDELTKLNNSVDLINSISSLPDELTSADKLVQIWKLGREHVKNLNQEFHAIQNGLQGDLLRIGVPAVQLFNENTSGIKLLPSSSSLSRISDLNNELKYKNVRQSAILMELHESILAIAQHFQSNDSDFKCNLTIDYDPKEVHKYKAHKIGLNGNKVDRKKEKCKRARALIDFKRVDDDELGFRKNDIIKILEDRDEHCWAGELNDQQGLFPSKLVEIINENYGNYNEFGDDSVHPFISDLVRGRLCAVIKCILNNGLRKGYFYTVHPWMIIEALAKNYMKSQQNNICSKVVLTKTFKLDDFESNMNVKELFYKSILVINESHANEPMDVKLRSLICVAVNHKLLDSWFTIYCLEDKSLIQKYYHSWAYVSTPVWQMIKLELALLKQFSFNLNPNAELLQEIQNTSSVSKAAVHDILVKHHLFSWDI